MCLFRHSNVRRVSHNWLQRGAVLLVIRRTASPNALGGCLKSEIEIEIEKGKSTMTPSNNATTSASAIGSNVSDLSSRVADRADKAIDATQGVADNAGNALRSGLDNLRDEMPFVLSKAGAGADALIAEGTERARQASQVVRTRTGQMQQQAAAYVREKPVTSLMWVAGAAAALTLLLTRSGGRR